MAWALSQIFTAATPGYGFDYMTEMWVNYYDIFVRNAFGNYRDVLREVTYSPVMGDYLTFKRNSAYDYNKNYPDENYAREVMQLFTIGLFKLHANGSKVLDAHGDALQTYTNDQVTDFARVFTGFDEQLPEGTLKQRRVLGITLIQCACGRLGMMSTLSQTLMVIISGMAILCAQISCLAHFLPKGLTTLSLANHILGRM
jgi:uncharacterized protein (DUF1800 family)